MKYFKIILLIISIKSKLVFYSNDLNNILKNEPLEYEMLHYGKIPMGRTVIGKLMPLELKEGSCEEFIHINLAYKDIGKALISFLDNCNPITLSKSAEKLGGNILILIKNKENIFLDKHLNGSKINIPTIWIDLEKGKLIYDFLLKKKIENYPILSFTKSVKKSDIIDLRIYMDLIDMRGYEFLLNFLVYIESFEDKLNFDFIFKNDNCITKGVDCKNKHIEEECLFNNQLLCRFNGTKDQLIDETYLKCSNELNILKEVLQIIKVYCKDKINRDCINEKLNLNSKFLISLNKCINDPFRIRSSVKTNNYAYNKLKNRGNDPVIYINEIPYIGSLTPENIFESICQSFLKSPKNCLYINKKYTYNQTFNDTVNNKKKKRNSAYLNIVMYIFILLIFCALFLYLIFTKAYSKILNTRIGDIVKDNVINYRTMKENE